MSFTTSPRLKAMRLLLLIISFYFSCLSFGQDTSQVDTIHRTLPSTEQDTLIADSNSSAVFIGLKKKKQQQKKKPKKAIIKDDTVASINETVKNDDATGSSGGLIIIGILVIAVLLLFSVFSLSTFGKSKADDNSSSKDEDFFPDYLNRLLLPRREYYRNVYLKSEAWKRKPYVVLKRDHWRCVYCGRPATQVHHTKYAGRNIGKEPIEWLVSVCRTCHDLQHQ